MSERVVRVCFIAPKAYPLFEPAVGEVFGGAELDLYQLAQALAEDECFAVSFIVADYGQAEVEQYGKIRVIKSLDFRRAAPVGAWRVWRALRRADSDVYMIKTASPGVPLVSAFCRRYGRAFVYRTASAAECDGSYQLWPSVRLPYG